MSIETEINRISTNVSDTLSAISEMGGEVPEDATSDDMASGVRSIPVGAKIDDTTPSTTTTYSSSKIESEISKLNAAKVNKTGWSADKYLGTDAEGNVIEKDVTEGSGGGVYVGAGDMPDGYNVQIDPNGTADLQTETWQFTLKDGSVVTKDVVTAL